MEYKMDGRVNATSQLLAIHLAGIMNFKFGTANSRSQVRVNYEDPWINCVEQMQLHGLIMVETVRSKF